MTTINENEISWIENGEKANSTNINRPLKEVLAKLNSSIFGENTVTEMQIVNNSVTENKIANNSVTENKIANNSVTENKIVDGSVTENKIANNSVTEDKIANDSVTTEKLATDVTNLIDSKVAKTTMISTNNGLTGGGDLSTDITIGISGLDFVDGLTTKYLSQKGTWEEVETGGVGGGEGSKQDLQIFNTAGTHTDAVTILPGNTKRFILCGAGGAGGAGGSDGYGSGGGAGGGGGSGCLAVYDYTNSTESTITVSLKVGTTGASGLLRDTEILAPINKSVQGGMHGIAGVDAEYSNMGGNGGTGGDGGITATSGYLVKFNGSGGGGGGGGHGGYSETYGGFGGGGGQGGEGGGYGGTYSGVANGGNGGQGSGYTIAGASTPGSSGASGANPDIYSTIGGIDFNTGISNTPGAGGAAGLRGGSGGGGGEGGNGAGYGGGGGGGGLYIETIDGLQLFNHVNIRGGNPYYSNVNYKYYGGYGAAGFIIVYTVETP